MENANIWLEILKNYGVPIFVMLACMVGLVLLVKAYRSDLKESKTDLERLNNQYHEDYARFTESLNKNTSAIELCVKLLDKTLDRIGDD